MGFLLALCQTPWQRPVVPCFVKDIPVVTYRDNCSLHFFALLAKDVAWRLRVYPFLFGVVISAGGHRTKSGTFSLSLCVLKVMAFWGPCALFCSPPSIKTFINWACICLKYTSLYNHVACSVNYLVILWLWPSNAQLEIPEVRVRPAWLNVRDFRHAQPHCGGQIWRLLHHCSAVIKVVVDFGIFAGKTVLIWRWKQLSYKTRWFAFVSWS